MPHLKVFKTHIGFYDMVVAAPSMKAAAEAWHSSPRLFAQGFAGPTSEADAVKAALEQPGVVLKRPHGKNAPYQAQPEPPTAPKPNHRQKKDSATLATMRRRQQAAQKRAAAQAARQAKQQAAAELEAIESQEADLRRRRRALQKKFHLRAAG